MSVCPCVCPCVCRSNWSVLTKTHTQKGPNAADWSSTHRCRDSVRPDKGTRRWASVVGCEQQRLPPSASSASYSGAARRTARTCFYFFILFFFSPPPSTYDEQECWDAVTWPRPLRSYVHSSVSPAGAPLLLPLMLG